jgi:hypothetical protein
MIEQIVRESEREGTTLQIAEEADRLAALFPDVNKRMICDMLIAAGLRDDLPLEMIDTQESCRDSTSRRASL